MKMKKKFCAIALVGLLGAASCASAAVTEEQVRAAWHEVAIAAELEELPLEISSKNEINAWVRNGSEVGFTRALMAILESEDEIFGILSHEAGHAKLGHYEKTVATNKAVGIAGGALGSALGGGAIANAAVAQGEELVRAGFSREQEVEADDFAVDTMVKAGRAPGAFYNSMERLVIARGAMLEPSGYLDHPPDERRLKHIEDRIRKKDPTAVISKLIQ